MLLKRSGMKLLDNSFFMIVKFYRGNIKKRGGGGGTHHLDSLLLHLAQQEKDVGQYFPVHVAGLVAGQVVKEGLPGAAHPLQVAAPLLQAAKILLISNW